MKSAALAMHTASTLHRLLGRGTEWEHVWPPRLSSDGDGTWHIRLQERDGEGCCVLAVYPVPNLHRSAQVLREAALVLESAARRRKGTVSFGIAVTLRVLSRAAASLEEEARARQGL